MSTDHAKNTAQGESRVFVRADRDGVDAHLDDWIIVTAGLGHVAKIENLVFLNLIGYK